MSEEKKTVELNDEELTKVVGGSGLHFGIAEISMFTKDGIEIWDTDVDVYRTDSQGEVFTVVYVSNNNYEGGAEAESTTFTFMSRSSSKVFLFTAKPGARQCIDIYKNNNIYNPM